MSNKLKWVNLEKPLSKPVLKVVNDFLKFEKMTPVQVSINQVELLSMKEFVQFNLLSSRAQQFHFYSRVRMLLLRL